MSEPLNINKPIRLIELFAGIGSQAKALKRLGANFEHYKISDWEVNAVASYKAIHKENDNTDYSANYTPEELTEILFNTGISTDGKKPLSLKEIARKNEQWKRTVYNNFKATNNIGSILNVKGPDLGIVDTDKYCYMMTYSFPCQDLSLAGKGKGMAKGANTRSGLLWEVERLLNECEELPQILLMENVTQVHGKNNKEHFDEWIAFLESKGYSNYWKDLNAKNFGIPQNRNRTFMVSVLGDYTYKFPKEFPLELRLKDMLEDSVDEKFYLSDVAIQGRLQSNFRQYNLDRSLINEKEVHPTILARYEGAPTLLKEPQVLGGIGEKKSNGGTQWYQQDRIYDDNVAISVTTAFNPYYKVVEPKIQKIYQLDGAYEQSGRVYSANGISPTIMSNSHGKTNGGYTSPKVITEIIDPFICASRGRNPENPSDRTVGIPTEQRLEPNFSGCSNTLTTVQKDNYVCEPTINKIDIPQTVRVRKYELNCAKLCEVLRDCKLSSGLNNQDIATHLNIPLTKVEHWFRKDKYFAIPDENIWFELKALLNVKTDEFDKAIMTFEEKEGVFEKSNRCYFPNGIAPTITCASENEKVIEPKINVVGNYSPSNHDASRIVATDGLAPTVKENHGTVTAVAERFFKQALETVAENDCAVGDTVDAFNKKINKSGISPTITTRPEGFKTAILPIVEPTVCEQRKDEGLRFFKGDYVGALRTIDACGDKRVIVPTNNKRGYDEAVMGDSINLEQPNSTTRRGRVGHGVAQTLNTSPQQAVVENYALRIRKLTPKECWRLMGFDDIDFEKAATVNSNSQLYKQAGNSIVVDVLCYIFREML